MITKISFNRLRFRAFHGVMEQERLVGNDFEVSLTVEYPFCKAMESDNLDHTLNYALLYDVIATEMQQPSQLLEHVAGRIIKAVKARFPLVKGGSISVAKLTPPIKGQMESVAVTVVF
ncbi:MAG: dihydroneopterin aldolase [Muribaculaceae bacterium]